MSVKYWICEPTSATGIRGGNVISGVLQDSKVRALKLTRAYTDPPPPKIRSLVDGVMTSLSSAHHSEFKAWEDEILPWNTHSYFNKENQALSPHHPTPQSSHTNMVPPSHPSPVPVSPASKISATPVTSLPSSKLPSHSHFPRRV